MIRDELVSAASEFLNITKEEVEEKIKNNPENAIRDWKNKKDIIDFYKTTDVYIFGLIEFTNDERLDNLIHPLKGLSGLKILDYGGGLGTLLLLLSKNNNCYYYDLESRTQDFCKFLARKFKRKITFLTEEEVYNNKYDLIITTDVLEHVERPVELFDKLNGTLEKYGYMLTTGLNFSVGEHTPMHLPENVLFQNEFVKYVNQHFNLILFQRTRKETIYFLVKK